MQIAAEIGQIVNHSGRTVFLACHYGMPLQYYGELASAYWPHSITAFYYDRPNEAALSVRERLDKLGFAPEYFIITDFAGYRRHHVDRRAYLTQNCDLLAETDRYLIYYRCVGG